MRCTLLIYKRSIPLSDKGVVKIAYNPPEISTVSIFIVFQNAGISCVDFIFGKL
jgi:hypothetical protein